MKKQINLILAIGLLILVVIFALMNNQVVPVNFGFSKVSLPLVLILFLAILIGFLAAVLVSATAMFSKNKTIKLLKQQVDKAASINAKEISQLKTKYEDEISQIHEQLNQQTKKAYDLDHQLQAFLKAHPGQGDK